MSNRRITLPFPLIIIPTREARRIAVQQLIITTRGHRPELLFPAMSRVTKGSDNNLVLLHSEFHVFAEAALFK